MKSSEKEKICLHCDGRVPIGADTCPYCASSLTSSGQKRSYHAPIFQHQSLEESLTSLYTPPYLGKRPPFQPPSHLVDTESKEPIKDPFLQIEEETDRPHRDLLSGRTSYQERSYPNVFWPTLLLTIGLHAAILGLMQLFFSHGGILRLQWDADYWFFYCLFSFPFLYFGYKKVRGLAD